MGHTCISHGCLLGHTGIYHGCLLTLTGSWVHCMHVRSSLVHTSTSVLHSVRWVLTVSVPLRVPHPETCIPECITLGLLGYIPRLASLSASPWGHIPRLASLSALPLGLHPETCVYRLHHRLLCLLRLRHPSCIIIRSLFSPNFPDILSSQLSPRSCCLRSVHGPAS